MTKASEFHPYKVDREIMGEMLTVYQETLSPRARAAFAHGYAGTISQNLVRAGLKAPENTPSKSAEVASSLKVLGLAELGPLLDASQVEETVGYFSRQPVYSSHTSGTATLPPGRLDEVRRSSHYGAYSLEQVLAAPHLLEIANSPLLIGAAGQYLGCVPTLYSLNCWWTFGGHADKAKVAHNFHRDPDDLKFCTLFIYLTDVAEGASCHEFVLSSHNPVRFDVDLQERCEQAGMEKSQAQELVRLTYHDDGNVPEVDEVVQDHLSDRVRRLHGPAGTAMLEDTFGLHRGAPLPRTDRLMFWARYGLGLNHGYLLNRDCPVPVDWRSRLSDSPLTRYINRLIIDMD